MTSIIRVRRINEKKAKADNSTPPAKVKVERSAEFKKDLDKYRDRIGAKFAEFLKMKMENPMSRFGSTDEHFTAGPYAGTGIIHAHINHDIQVLYTRSGRDPTIIRLLRIGSHDDFGTGQPSNNKIMKSTVKQIDRMVTEAKKGDVLTDKFLELRNRYKDWKNNNGPKLTQSEETRLKVLKHIKDQEIWEVAGTRAPFYGPALSNRVSATREIVLQKRSPDGKILVAQRSDTITPGEDTMARTFANTDAGYLKALEYYIALSR